MFRQTYQRQEKGLLEVLLKRFFRDRVVTMDYLNLISITLVAIYFIPLWIKWVIFSFFLFALLHWLKSVYHHLLDHFFFTVVQYDEKINHLTLLKFRKLIALPVIFIVGGLTIIFSFL